MKLVTLQDSCPIWTGFIFSRGGGVISILPALVSDFKPVRSAYFCFLPPIPVIITALITF